MTEPTQRQGVPRASGEAAAPLPAIPQERVWQMRAVHRAASELRRGTPVVLEGAAPMIVLPAETAGANGLAELSASAADMPVLLLAPVRAAAVLRRPIGQSAGALAIRLSARLFDAAVLRTLADPVAELMLPEPPEFVAVPAGAEAAIALAKIARLLPAIVAAPLRGNAGPEASRLLRVAGADILAYPIADAATLARVVEARVPLADAPDARMVAFRAADSAIEHFAIVIGEPGQSAAPPLVRLHSECFTGDLLGSLRCDCGQQLRGALARMAEAGCGALLYLAQEGRGIGLVNKLRAYALQDRGLDTIDANRALGWGADERNFMIAATMLEQLGIREVRLLTNNPDKLAALAACGIHVVAREPLVFAPNGVDDAYLATKAARFGHYLG